MGWRFFARRLNGDGTETGLHPELPVTSCRIIEPLSAPMELTLELEPESVSAALFVPWSTAIYAEQDQVIRGAGIIDIDDGVVSADSKLTLKTVGWAGYLAGMPWVDGPVSYISKDPGEILPSIWAKVQSHKAGNIGLQVPTVKTGRTVGTPKKGKTPAEPFLLASYATADLQTAMTDLLAAGGIEYREQHAWGAGEKIQHSLLMASPRIGRRLSDLRLVVGENVTVVPEVVPAEYASEVILLGAGEGTKKIVSRAVNPAPARLRRAFVVNAETVTRQAAADLQTAALLKLLAGTNDDIATLTVLNSPSAPIGALTPGDEVRLTGDTGWAGRVDVWLRILQRTWDPIKTPDQVALDVVRADKVGTN